MNDMLTRLNIGKLQSSSDPSIYPQLSVFFHVERGKIDTMLSWYNEDGNKVIATIIFTCSTYTSAWDWIREDIPVDK